MDREMRVMLRNNIIKFAIGSVLLVVCFVYLGKHPAEKTSVLSWFEVMYQKGQLLVHKVVYDDTALLEKKINLQKYYKELIRTAEEGNCVTPEEKESLNENYDGLTNLKWKITEDELAKYIRAAYRFDASIKESCN